MTDVHFSVPDEVAEAFDKTFAGRDKSKIVADLLAQAVRGETSGSSTVRSTKLARLDEILAELRAQSSGRLYSDEDLQGAREVGRP